MEINGSDVPRLVVPVHQECPSVMISCASETVKRWRAAAVVEDDVAGALGFAVVCQFSWPFAARSRRMSGFWMATLAMLNRRRSRGRRERRMWMARRWARSGREKPGGLAIVT